MRFLTGTIVRLLSGGVLGAIAAGIITGDEVYAIVLAVGLPIVFTVGTIIVATRSTRKRKGFTRPGQVPGINATVVGQSVQEPAAPVLNPSAGVLLNGEPVATAATTPATASAGRPLGLRLLSLLTIAAGAALALIPAYGIIGWMAEDAAAGRPFDGRDMRYGLHQQEAFDAIVAVMGDTQVTSISFYDSYLAVTAPTTPGARTVDRFEWRSGRAARVGPDYSQPADIREELFDAGAMDMGVVARVVRQSLDDADLEGVEGIYPSIRRFAGEPPEISVTITNAYFTASYDYTLEGELIQRGGSAFD
ncbi:MAG TPA: hypothetical protein VNR36_05425 [Pseudolysinimonas sp.]|nr:hypothetical protein [Pseudolysinimonas sp.]